MSGEFEEVPTEVGSALIRLNMAQRIGTVDVFDGKGMPTQASSPTQSQHGTEYTRAIEVRNRCLQKLGVH